MRITATTSKEVIKRGKALNPDKHLLTRAFRRLGEPLRTVLPTFLIFLLAPAAVAMAQGTTQTAAPPQNKSLIAHNKGLYGGIKKILLSSAEKMPEENYSFKPTDAVRSYGQIVGHIADSQYYFCSLVLGEKNPGLGIEKTKTSKADLIAALKDAFAYCDRAHNSITEASATQMVKFMGNENPKLGVLSVNNVHSALHYGNLITYMRLKNIVPPSSDPDFMKQLSR